MLGYFDLAGTSQPCADCGSTSGDCAWLANESRCSAGCATCGGRGAARCGYCGEVVPCGAESRRNPHPDARCAWISLASLHGTQCPWTSMRGGAVELLPARLARL